MNIIFLGDWIKYHGVWRQVFAIHKNQIGIFHSEYDTKFIDADDEQIEQILSDPEMQTILENVA
jgi:hypothetical protein